jgi:hypothetical protein
MDDDPYTERVDELLTELLLDTGALAVWLLGATAIVRVNGLARSTEA